MSIVYRWVRKFEPQLEIAFRNGKKCLVGKSRRINETYIKIKGRWRYLSRAVKRIVRSMLGFKSSDSARCILCGIELMRSKKDKGGGPIDKSFQPHNDFTR